MKGGAHPSPSGILSFPDFGWSGDAIVLDKLPVPGRPTYLDNSGARAYCACSRCRRGCLEIFLSFLSPCLWETARYRLKYCLKGPLNPKPTNQTSLIKTCTHLLLGKKHLSGWRCMKRIIVRRRLTLKAPITTAADDIHEYFYCISEKI